MVDKKFVIELQGKQFITHEGLLDEFHKKGGKEISTELISSDGGTYIFKATVKILDNKDPKKAPMEKIFTGHGDANKDNVNSNIAKHLIRMAETRAINRAMRFATNIGMCSTDELEDVKDTKGETKVESFGKDVKVPNKCSQCNADVTDKVKKYSIDNFKKVLCFPCQEKEKEKK